MINKRRAISSLALSAVHASANVTAITQRGRITGSHATRPLAFVSAKAAVLCNRKRATLQATRVLTDRDNTFCVQRESKVQKCANAATGYERRSQKRAFNRQLRSYRSRPMLLLAVTVVSLFLSDAFSLFHSAIRVQPCHSRLCVIASERLAAVGSSALPRKAALDHTAFCMLAATTRRTQFAATSANDFHARKRP